MSRHSVDAIGDWAVWRTTTRKCWKWNGQSVSLDRCGKRNPHMSNTAKLAASSAYGKTDRDRALAQGTDAGILRNLHTRQVYLERAFKKTEAFLANLNVQRAWVKTLIREMEPDNGG